MSNHARRRSQDHEPLHERWVAEQDEHSRFNAACARGGPALLQTEAGLRLVWRVTPDWWYVCGPDDTTAESLPGRNDQAWAALMAWVREPRHPLLAKRLGNPNERRRS